MSIGNVDSVDLAAIRQAPAPARGTPPDARSSGGLGAAPAPVIHAPARTPAQRATLDNPVFPPVQPATQEALAAAVQSANAYVQSVSTNIQFTLDQDTGRTVVKMVDTETEEVLRQFPSEEMLAISRSIDRMQGLLINRKV
ncbi:MAG: flagellar protein FlaG [Candidatus Thermoplasmatota archaeon]|mgnify:CR=1 FL=1|nr:flagellar protein FlaG [Candidatus Thermoplasmatota archaeon]